MRRRMTRIRIKITRPLLVLLLVTLITPIIRNTQNVATITFLYTFKYIPVNSTRLQKESVSDAYLDNLTASVAHLDVETFRKATQLHQEAKGVFQYDNLFKKFGRKLLKPGSHGNNLTENSMLDIEVETKHEAQKVDKPEPTKTKSMKPDEDDTPDCLPLRLSTEYYSLNSSAQQFPNQENLDDPNLFHYALFSHKVLPTAVVVNSTVTNAKDPSKHVFHIVTDTLNYAAIRMWFLLNPPGDATVHVQNIDEFTWLDASYSHVLNQLVSQNATDYHFETQKFQNPKYLSKMNHIRFYLPEIFPKLSKVMLLDDDIVVQKDLTDLWSIDLKGKVNGAVETCGESFHRFERYLNFSHPVIAKKFDPRASGWAYGMNVFDLEEWKKQNITAVHLLRLWVQNHERNLWKLGTLSPGLITFWKRVCPLENSWHVLGLGYNPRVSEKEIERAAVIHYNGNLKPWLEIGIPKFRGYWNRYVDYDQPYMRDCNMSTWVDREEDVNHVNK